ADQIKEYSIALEALGRSSDFDPKKDSIVRVEAHRLRRRLEEYYRGTGADNAVHIVIPNGQYRPQFILQNRGSQAEPLIHRTGIVAVSEPNPTTIRETEVAPDAEERLRLPGRHRWWPWVAGLAVLISAAAFAFSWHRPAPDKPVLLPRTQIEKWSG